MFTNLCLALLFQLAGLFVLKFHFRKIEKAKEKSWNRSDWSDCLSV